MDTTTEPVQPSIAATQPDQTQAVIPAPGVKREQEVGPAISFASSPETVPLVENQPGIRAIDQHNNPQITKEHQQIMTISPAAQPAPVTLSDSPIAMTLAEAKIEQKGSAGNSSSWLGKLWSKFFTPKPQGMEGGVA